jgi:hypothetical protein
MAAKPPTGSYQDMPPKEGYPKVKKEYIVLFHFGSI